MIVHDELYILLNDSRRKIEIQNPSGISLKFQSNMFNDLSKFAASYSYTFKIPKTKNNIEAFDLVDEIRHSSVAYGKKIQCELYRDGVKLFDNSYLYINEGGKDYSAVITWNVLSWLLEIKESGKSIKDIEKDFAGQMMTVVDFETDRSGISNSQSMGDDHVDAQYRCGTPVVYRRPKVVPVRYLLDKIAMLFDKGGATDIFSFVRSTPLTNNDFKDANLPFNIADDGAIPMVNGKWSNNYLQTQMRIVEREKAIKNDDEYPMLDLLANDLDSPSKSDSIIFIKSGRQFVYFNNLSGSSDYVKFHKHTGTATKGEDVFVKDEDGNDTEEIDWSEVEWTKDETPNGMYMGFSPVISNLKLKLRGRIRTTDYGTLRLVPIVSFFGSVYSPIYDDDGVMQETIEIRCNEVEGASGLYEYNFDPEHGGSEIEIEPVENVRFWVIQITNYSETFIVDGYMKFFPDRENITYGYVNPPALSKVDLFHNLPDIKIIDFLKALFFIEKSYPFIEKDGRIGQMRYEDLYRNIRNGSIYDWSDILIGSAKNDSVKYTNGNLGRVNRFNMKNYSDTNRDEEVTALRYDEASSYFPTENDTLSAENTIYTFPYASAAKVTKEGFSVGDTFIFWELDKDGSYKVAGSIDPIIGRVSSCREGRNYIGGSWYTSEYLKFSIWQVANREYDNSVIAAIFKKPFVIETKLFLDTFTLSTLDFTKPVYLNRYNAYFGIISVNCDSKGISKAELIKLPHINLSDIGSNDIPEIVIEGSPVVFKKTGIDAIAKYTVSASVRGTRINRMVVSLDGETLADGDMEKYVTSQRFESGVHVLTVTAYAANGKYNTESFETRVDFAAEGASIDFVEYSTGLSISNTKRNIAKFKVVLYNATSTGLLRIFKSRRGSSDKVMLGNVSTGKELEVNWEYYDQLKSNGTADVNWTISAEFESDTEKAVNTKNVLVSVDRSMLKYYNGIVSGTKIQVMNNSTTLQEGSSMSDIFKYGDFNIQMVVSGAQVTPYYVEYYLDCYSSGSSTPSRRVFTQDPYYGTSYNGVLKKTEYQYYKRIEVSAMAYYYDSVGSTRTTGKITLYP